VSIKVEKLGTGHDYNFSQQDNTPDKPVIIMFILPIFTVHSSTDYTKFSSNKKIITYSHCLLAAKEVSKLESSSNSLLSYSPSFLAWLGIG